MEKIDFKQHVAKKTKSQLQKFQQFDGSWNEYLDYLQDNGGNVSKHLERDFSGEWSLKEGYNPPWTLKDFT
ncbi:MAG: hypothetical protein JKY71_00165 [Alphaproteobacteria bacterium]|nr:hypothetical protein [Alphaproteobacteria bacterium]